MFNNRSSNQFDLVFKNNNMLVKLLYANLLVFIGIKILYLPFWLMDTNISAAQFAKDWLAVPSYLPELITRPWTVFSYMFLHLGFFHLLSNMLWLYFLGRLFMEFLGEKKLWSVYVGGGITGAVLYILFFNLFPVFEDVNPVAIALGASASVMAVVAAVGTYAPNFTIRPFNLFDLKLKYIAIFFFVSDLINISNSNSGGHIAHIGGAIFGYFFAIQWRKNVDISSWVDTATSFILSIFNRRPNRMKVKYRRSNRTSTNSGSPKKEQQQKVDEILDKISRSGYDSLSKEEKDFLFRASNNS